jgi:hypothetical protein
VPVFLALGQYDMAIDTIVLRQFRIIHACYEFSFAFFESIFVGEHDSEFGALAEFDDGDRRCHC